MSFGYGADLFGRSIKNPAGILAYSKGFWGDMTDKDVPYTGDRSF